MIKKIAALAAAAVMLAACGCSQKNNDSAEKENSDVKIYQDSNGALVYEFSNDTPFEEISGQPETRGESRAVSAPEDAISIEEAEKAADSCSFKEFYLPTKVSDYKKYYYETISGEEQCYYRMCCYLEKNGVRLFMGTDFLVSCDGKEVSKRDWTGSYQDVKPGSAKDDPSADTLYPGAKVMPTEAIFAICDVDQKKLGLTESLQTYIFEVEPELFNKKSIDCYKATPKLVCSDGIKLGNPIYITADGTNRILINDPKTNELVLVN